MSGPTTIEHPSLGQTQPVVTYQDREILGNYDTLDDWSLVAANSGANLVLADEHIRGLKSLSFDKVSTGNDAATVENTSLNLDLSRFYHDSVIRMVILIPDVTNVDKVFVDIGSDITNITSYALSVAPAANQWLILEKKLTDRQVILGTGWNLSNIKYIKIGVIFSLTTDTLANILVDEVSIITL